MKSAIIGIIASLRAVSIASQCLIGDILYQPGDSIGVAQYECLNKSSWIGTEGICQDDGNVTDQPIVGVCPESIGVGFCVQCRPPGRHASLCLSSPETPDYCEISIDVLDDPDTLDLSEAPSPSPSLLADGANGTVDCTIDNVLYLSGETTGISQYFCLNKTTWVGTQDVCKNGQSIPSVLVHGECSESDGFPYCVQCGPVGPHAALCHTEPVTPSTCAEVTTLSPPDPFCFPGDMTVRVEGRGIVTMEDLKIGDRVQIEEGVFSEIYSFGHYKNDVEAVFIRLVTASAAVELSKDHMVVRKNRQSVPVASLRVGDEILLSTGILTPVIKIEKVLRRGLYAPFTQHGLLAVNGIVASSYISFEEDSATLTLGGWDSGISYQWLAHAFETPHRAACSVLVDCSEETYTESGISKWVEGPHQIAIWWKTQGAFVRGLLVFPFVLLLGIFAAVEFVILFVVGLVPNLPDNALSVFGQIS